MLGWKVLETTILSPWKPRAGGAEAVGHGDATGGALCPVEGMASFPWSQGC